jgi:hypothetical protein
MLGSNFLICNNWGSSYKITYFDANSAFSKNMTPKNIIIRYMYYEIWPKIIRWTIWGKIVQNDTLWIIKMEKPMKNDLDAKYKLVFSSWLDMSRRLSA